MHNRVTVAFGAAIFWFCVSVAQAGSDFGPIESEFYNECLQAGDMDGIPTFQPCDDTNLSQIWFLTRADTRDANALSGAYEVGPMDINRQTVRSAAFPNRCLTAIEDPDQNINNDVLALRSCEGSARQRWEPNWSDDRLEYNDECASATHNRLYTQACSRRKPRQALDASNIGRVTNFDIGDFITDFPDVEVPDGHRFHDYADCKAQADSDEPETTCFINMGNVQRFGFKLGTNSDLVGFLDNLTGGGRQGTNNLLDLGDRYSVDRCSMGHDWHTWYREEESELPHPVQYNYVACLSRVVATTTQERTAQVTAIAAFGLVDNALTTAGMLVGDDLHARECTDEVLGWLPPAGEPVETCWCCILMPQANEVFAAAQSIVDRGVSVLALAELDIALSAIDEDPVMTNDAPGYPDVAVGCSSTVRREFRDLEDGLRATRDAWADQLAPSPRLIVRGDTLWGIATEQAVEDIPAYVRSFVDLNPRTAPDLIFAGETYMLPAPVQP